MNPLTTAEVLRLLEGGNESPLAKRCRESAAKLAATVEGRIIDTIGLPIGAFRVTIPSEVVTRKLGPIKSGGYSNESGQTKFVEVMEDRPAIVISTEP